MKIQTFGEIPAKTACPGKIWLIFNEISRMTRRILEWSIQVGVNFLTWVGRMDFILHILIILNVLNNLVTISYMVDHSKPMKNHFWMIQIAKNEVFGHFLELGTSGGSHITYSDNTKCFLLLGYGKRSCIIN